MFNKNLVPWIVIAILLVPLSIVAQIKCDTTKYKPGFSYFDGSSGEQVTLIKLSEDKTHPDFKKQIPNYCPLVVWNAVIESTRCGVIFKAMVGESSIDLALGKAYVYHGRIIYYDSEEDCNSKAKNQ